MSKQNTLIEKLEKEVERLLELKAKEKPDSLAYMFLGHHIASTVNAINIVKQHEAESGWISVDEQLHHLEEMLTNHYNPKEFYEIILKTGELLIASYTHMKNDGINEILFMDCTIVLTGGRWELSDAGFDGYQTDEVAYRKPIQPPK